LPPRGWPSGRAPRTPRATATSQHALAATGPGGPRATHSPSGREPGIPGSSSSSCPYLMLAKAGCWRLVCELGGGLRQLPSELLYAFQSPVQKQSEVQTQTLSERSPRCTLHKVISGPASSPRVGFDPGAEARRHCRIAGPWRAVGRPKMLVAIPRTAGLAARGANEGRLVGHVRCPSAT
jgi:hypothetical protein